MGFYAPALMFASMQLENRFREIVSVKEEVGGWLFASYWNCNNLDYRTLRNNIGYSFIMQIESWLLVPNASEFPTTQFTHSNFKTFKEAAEMTAKSMRCSAFNFHSHPNGNNEPSATDVAFTLNHCRTWRNAGESVIVSLNPLRVNAYVIHRKDRTIKMVKGDYWSWRHKIIKEAAGVAR